MGDYPKDLGNYPNGSEGFPNDLGDYLNGSGGFPNDLGGCLNGSGGFPDDFGDCPNGSGDYPKDLGHRVNRYCIERNLEVFRLMDCFIFCGPPRPHPPHQILKSLLEAFMRAMRGMRA